MGGGGAFFLFLFFLVFGFGLEVFVILKEELPASRRKMSNH